MVRLDAQRRRPFVEESIQQTHHIRVRDFLQDAYFTQRTWIRSVIEATINTHPHQFFHSYNHSSCSHTAAVPAVRENRQAQPWPARKSLLNSHFSEATLSDALLPHVLFHLKHSPI